MICQMYSDCRTPAVALIPTPAGDRIATCAECAPHQQEIDMTTTATLAEQFHDFLTGAAEAALWSTIPLDNDGMGDFPADEYHLGGDELTKLRGTLAHHSRDWFVTYHPLVRRAMSGNPEYRDDWFRVGHDWWLTTQGHGAGFWDRGLGTAGAALTATCEGYEGILDLYLDEGVLRVDTYNVMDFNESLDDALPLAVRPEQL